MDIHEIINDNNHKVLIDIKKLSIDERKELADFFSEGSKTLGMALRTLWNKKLYTTACCKGHLFGERDWMFSRMYSYIAFDKDINVFQKTNFKFLEILDLSSNKIANIEILSKVKFNQLENLN